MSYADQQRTTDIYEQIAAYPLPPLAKVPSPQVLFDELIQIQRHALGRLNAALLFKGSGFSQFLQSDPNQIASLLRTTYLRNGGDFAPIVSATSTIQADDRKPDPIARAAMLVMSAISLHKDFYAGTLPPDKHGDQIMEMGQYGNLFSTSFVYESGQLRLFKTPQHSHLIVIVNGHFYQIGIAGLTGDAGLETLHQCFKQVVEDAKRRVSTPDQGSPGVFTCCDPKLQKQAFTYIAAQTINQAALQATKHSFLTVSLDLDDHPATDAEALRLAHSLNAENRWYYASTQLVVFANAKAALIYSFAAYLDGNVMARSAVELVQRSRNMPLPSLGNHDAVMSDRITPLAWKIDPVMQRQAYQSLRFFQDSQPATYTMAGIGRNLFKQYQIDAVSLFVVALAMSAYQFTGRLPKLIQLLTLAKFRCMGLNGFDAVTQEVAGLIQLVSKTNYDRQAAATLLRHAVSAQQSLLRARRSTLPAPELFGLYRVSCKGLKKVYVNTVVNFSMWLGKLIGSMPLPPGPDVIISHPAIFPEVTLLGRPGVRLPYVNFFALHYQIFDEETVVTIMPGMQWPVSNAKLTRSIQDNIHTLLSVLQTPAVSHAANLMD